MKNFTNPIEWVGRTLATYLSKQDLTHIRNPTTNPEYLASSLQKGDVLLVEGVSRFSSAIKYITQSTWSHAALCVADNQLNQELSTDACQLLEADVLVGVQLVPLSRYSKFHTRICRPVGLTPNEINSVIDFARSKIGLQYDLKHIFDLARYLIQAPPVAVGFRRRLLALGSGEPTKAICSSLIAQAFQSIRYPILPEIEKRLLSDLNHTNFVKEYLHIRHHSLFAPRDFDISPYFDIIKPTLEHGFDSHTLVWDD